MFRQDWKNGLHRVLFVAIAAFVIAGFTLVNAGNRITVAADSLPCEVAWLTEDSHIPLDVIDLTCSLVKSDVDAKVGTAAINRSSSRVTDSGVLFESYLQALERIERERNAAFVAPSVSFEAGFVHWETYLDTLGVTERELDAEFTAPSAGFDPMSWEYTLDAGLAAPLADFDPMSWEHTLDAGLTASSVDFDPMSWQYTLEVE